MTLSQSMTMVSVRSDRDGRIDRRDRTNNCLNRIGDIDPAL